MRQRFEKNPDLFTIPISAIKFHSNCRDEAPKLLKGLQAIFMDEQLNESIFLLLSNKINNKRVTLIKSGRTGMGLWEILVLCVMRQGLNANYDRIHYLANSDTIMRSIMGIECESNLAIDRKQYGLTTIKDNVALLDEQTLNEINAIVVGYGHRLLKKKEETLQVKADSFPVGANVHFPTDMNLLWDASRKCIDTAQWISTQQQTKGWRKANSWKTAIKRIFRISSKTNSSGGKYKEERTQNVVSQYIDLCHRLSLKVTSLLAQKQQHTNLSVLAKHLELEYYHKMLIKHIDLVDRRILQSEVIPSSEKLYSIFETHAEWLTKGKKYTPVEIGHNVLIATDQFNFIIYHQVLEKQTDSGVTQELATTLVNRFPNQIESLSLDKGFYSKANKEFVQNLIPKAIMPKKGKTNQAEKQEEAVSAFKKLRNAHSAVESNINQLEHNGLGRCPDRGIENFKRYATASVLAYNIHKLGEHLDKRKRLKKVA